MTAAEVAALSDSDLCSTIGMIEEGLAECGRRSAYASVNLPVLKLAKAEAAKRARVKEA